MRRTLWALVGGAGLLLSAGCATGPLLDNPAVVRPGENQGDIENPVYVPLGPQAYGTVFENVLDILDDYFDIAYANRYDGRIETWARVSPGLERFWLPGSPDFAQRAYATLQSVRHRAVALIQVADDGGFFVEVKVYKELEDLPKPSRVIGAASAFRFDSTVEKQVEVVVDDRFSETNWIPIGRDVKLEQKLLERIKGSM